MTTAGPPPTRDPAHAVEALLNQSWLLFRKNWIVALPPVIGTVIVALGVAPLLAAVAFAVVGAIRVPHVVPASAGWSIGLGSGAAFAIGIGVAVAFAISVAVSLYSVAASYGMADAAWSRGTTTLADGWAAFRRRSGALSVAGLAVFGVALAALLLALPTLGLSLFAFPLVTLYVVPSVVAGGRGGFAAVGESFRLVRRSLGRSVVVLLVQITISYVLVYLAELAILPVIFSMVQPGPETALLPPSRGSVAAGVLFGTAYILGVLGLGGFYAIVLVGFYRWLRAEAPAAPPAEP